MAALIVSIWLNNGPEDAIRGYGRGDPIERAARLHWGFLAPDLHDRSQVRLYFPGRRAWNLDDLTLTRVASSVLKGVNGLHPGTWEAELAGRAGTQLPRPLRAGDLLHFAAPTDFATEFWGRLPACLYRSRMWWHHPAQIPEEMR